MRSCGGGEIEQRDAAIDERRDAAIDDRCDAIVELELSLWLSDWSSRFADEVSSSSLFSLSLSSRKCFEVKIETENNFRGQSLIFMVK